MKKASAFLLFALILACVFLGMPMKTYAASHSVATFAQLQTALTDTDPAINITVTASFDLTAQLTIPAGKTVTIASDATTWTLTRAAGFTGRLFEVAAGGSLTYSNIVLDGNRTNVAAVHPLIYNSGTLTLGTNVILQNNNNSSSANLGGGIFNNGGQVTLQTGASIINNTAERGGGIHTNSGTVTINAGASISNNTVRVSGAGVDLVNSALIVQGTIQGNRATMNGGGIYNSGGQVTLQAGALLSGNGSLGTTSTTGGGGNIYSSGATGKVTMNAGALITGGSAYRGGGIYSVVSSTVEMNGGTIENNSVTADGGGIYVTNSTVILHAGALITDNTAVSRGGGIYTAISTLTVDAGAVISENTAGTVGGGICVTNESVVAIGGSIDHNTANNGGGVYNSVSAVTAGVGSQISANTAVTDGGGIYNTSSSVFTISGGSVETNIAGNSGGGIYNSANVTIGAGTVKGNGAVNGGGVYTTGAAGLLQMDGGAVVSNTASGLGTGIFFDNGAVILGGTATVGTTLGTGNGFYLNVAKVIEIKSGYAGFANIEKTADPYLGRPVVQGVAGYEAQTGDLAKFNYYPKDYILVYKSGTHQIVLGAISQPPTPVPTTGDPQNILGYTAILLGILVCLGILIKKKYVE